MNVIEICNKLSDTCARHDPDHPNAFDWPDVYVQGVQEVDAIVERLCSVGAVTEPELYRKVEALCGLCDAESHQEHGGITLLLESLELGKPDFLDHWPKAEAELRKAADWCDGPIYIKLLESIARDVARMRYRKDSLTA